MSIESLSFDVLSKIFGEFDITDARNFRLTSVRFAQASKHNIQLYEFFKKMVLSMKMSNHHKSFKFAPCHTKDIICNAVLRDMKSAKYVKWQPDILLYTLKNCTPQFLDFVNIRDEESQMKMIDINYKCIAYMHRPSAKVCKYAISKNIDLFRYQVIYNRDDVMELRQYAISSDWRAVLGMHTSTDILIIMALDSFYKTEKINITIKDNNIVISDNVLKSCGNPSKDVIHYAIAKQSINIIYADDIFIQDHLHLAINALMDNPLLIGYKHLMKHVIRTPDIYKQVVQLDSRCLQFIPPEHRTEELCIIAVQRDVNVIKHVPVFTHKILQAADSALL